jgi:hypothetical protein
MVGEMAARSAAVMVDEKAECSAVSMAASMAHMMAA